MKKYKLLALTACLAVAGCATTSGPSGTEAAVESREAAPRHEAQAPLPAVIPDGPLSAIQPSELSSQSVTSLEPPPDLWARIRRGFAMPNLDTDLVRRQEQWYATRPDYIQRMTDRSRKYLFHIVEELERRNMPTELALLPFIESAFNPQAVSSARAAGMWQFMPATGKDYDLKQNVFRDDRRDVLASTRAALDYLARLHAMFGDWHLALAAYNWGEGNVQRAVARNQRAGQPADYLSLRMPAETRNYVPKLQAVKNIVLGPERFGLSLPAVANHPHFLSVPITRDIDVELAARLSGMTPEDFKALNPQMNKPVILAAGTPYVLLPYDNANLFVRAVADHKGAMATWTAWVAPRTLRASEAAKQVGMREETLRDINRIPPRMLVKAGSTLLVARTPHRNGDVSEHIADNAIIALAPEARPLRRVALRAGRKDTVASVAQRYRVSAQQVAQWNRLAASASFKPGQTVVVYVAGKAASKSAQPGRRTASVKSVRPTARAQVRAAKVSTKVSRSR